MHFNILKCASIISRTCHKVFIYGVFGILYLLFGASKLASKQNYGKLLKAAAYSTPVDGSMFIIHMGSEQYGVIDSLTVHFYDSDETMLLGIQHVLRDVTRVPAEVLEYQKMDEILSFFF